jgi:hypothetical protein
MAEFILRHRTDIALSRSFLFANGMARFLSRNEESTVTVPGGDPKPSVKPDCMYCGNKVPHLLWKVAGQALRSDA